jgi:hypothetical protein
MPKPKIDRREFARLRRILARELGHTDPCTWGECDIPTREQIDRLCYRIMRLPEPRIVEV